MRDVIVSLGANDILQGDSATTITNDLASIVTNIQGWTREDDPGEKVNVFVTTIPPLGLAQGDTRETNLNAVNQWITGGNLPQPEISLDIASVVQSSSNPNDINPAYLNGGVPDAAFYQQVAATIANDIATDWFAGPPPNTVW